MAAVDYFLKIDGIKGESILDENNNIDSDSLTLAQIALRTVEDPDGLTFDYWSLNFVAPPDDHASAPFEFFELNFNKLKIEYMPQESEDVNKLGEAIQDSIDNETLDAKILLQTQATEGTTYLKITFSDVLISSYQTGGAGDGADFASDGLLTAGLTDPVDWDPPPHGPPIDPFAF